MVILTIKCSRCSKEVSHDMTNRTIDDSLISKFGYVYLHNGKTNVLICKQCEKLFKGLEDKLVEQAKEEMCNFFKNCGKDNKDGNKGKSDNG